MSYGVTHHGDSKGKTEAKGTNIHVAHLISSNPPSSTLGGQDYSHLTDEAQQVVTCQKSHSQEVASDQLVSIELFRRKTQEPAGSLQQKGGLTP